jgi:hypothetical protein
MSEDPKGFDAGDYNLFRYCHNDPEDLTDPMGLWSTTEVPGPPPAPPHTYREFHTGSLIPYSVSSSAHGASFSASPLQIIGQMAHQNATMAQAWKAQSEGTISSASRLTYAPLRDRDGQPMVDNGKDSKTYYYQLLDRGKPLKQPDLHNQERLLSSSPPTVRVNTSEYGKPTALSSQGILKDVVALKASPGDVPPTRQVFGNTLWWHGSPYPVSTQFTHDISRTNGVVEIRAWISKP